MVDGRFSVFPFVGRWMRTVHIHVSHIALPYTVINVHGNMEGGGRELN